MIQVLVTLQIKDFSLLEEFEREAVSIMAKYQGCLLSAFETSRMPDGTGEEVHILEFASEEMFGKYRVDNALLQLTDLREKAISKTEVKISLCEKSYV